MFAYNWMTIFIFPSCSSPYEDIVLAMFDILLVSKHLFLIAKRQQLDVVLPMLNNDEKCFLFCILCLVYSAWHTRHGCNDPTKAPKYEIRQSIL